VIPPPFFLIRASVHANFTREEPHMIRPIIPETAMGGDELVTILRRQSR